MCKVNIPYLQWHQDLWSIGFKLQFAAHQSCSWALSEERSFSRPRVTKGNCYATLSDEAGRYENANVTGDWELKSYVETLYREFKLRCGYKDWGGIHKYMAETLASEAAQSNYRREHFNIQRKRIPTSQNNRYQWWTLAMVFFGVSSVKFYFVGCCRYIPFLLFVFPRFRTVHILFCFSCRFDHSSQLSSNSKGFFFFCYVPIRLL